MRVLVAEDEFSVRALLVDTLKRGGFEVVEAASGDEALQLLAFAHRIDILVADIDLPGTDGIALARGARARYPALPVLFLGGGADMLADRDDAPHPHRFLSKPFTLTRLAGTLGEMVRELEQGLTHAA